MGQRRRRSTIYHYSLPCNSGLILKGKLLTEREGLLIRLNEEGREGWGEIAPLAGFSQETLVQAEQQLRLWQQKWQAGIDVELNTLFPSVAFGISMACYELSGQLTTLTDFCTVPLCTESSITTLKRLNGKSLAKLKIGRYSPEQDGQHASRLLTARPDLRLRLDANRAWSLEQAGIFAQQLTNQQRKQIEFIEEPCLTPAESLIFAEQHGIAIAWDESTREMDFRLAPSPYLAALILKPTLLGSVQRCLSLIQQANQYGIQTVISSSLESSLALTQLSCFATQHTPHSVAGLDTLHLMPYQLLRRWGKSDLPLLDLDSPFIKTLGCVDNWL